MDAQIFSPAPDDHDSGRHPLVVALGHRFGPFGCLVASEMPPILGGRVANRVANRVAKQVWPSVFPRILRNVLFDARWRVHATLFATLMSMLVAVDATNELQDHDDDRRD